MDRLASLLTEHSTAITYWIGAICTFAIFSILYKENPLYRLFEHIFIGLAAGQSIYITWAEFMKPKWWEPMVLKGQWWWVFAVVPGLMFYFIYSQRHNWIARIMMGAFMGLTAGLIFQDFANNYIPMMRGSFKPLIPAPGVGWTAAINNIIFVAVLISVMAYFFFSIDHKAPAMKKTATLGKWLLMFAFGAMFGATVMARMSLFIGRVDFLLTDWGPTVPLWFWIAIAGAIIALVLYVKLKPGRPKQPGPPSESDTVSEQTVTDVP